MNRSFNTLLRVAFLSAGLLAVPLVRAQLNGSIAGSVTDPSGRAVPGASIRIVEAATHTERQSVTDREGRYMAADLPPGTYAVEISHDGFQVSRIDGLELTVGRTLRADVELRLGTSNETVAVTADMQAVDTQSGAWSSDISQQQLAGLPLNGRDVFDLASQQLGVQTPTSSTSSLNTGLGIHMSVNGSRPSENAFRLDGIYINDASGSAPASAAGTLLGLEAIAELNLVTAPFSAEYGRSGGGFLTAVSKSGTNEYHGALYEYLRNSALDAKNYFDPGNQPIPPLRRNQFGGLATGPIVKNKLFFMANYEGVRIAANNSQTIVTPNLQARSGLLPVNGVLTQMSVSASILPYLGLYPLPNGTDLGNGTGNYSGPVPTDDHEDYVTAKVDYVPSERWRFNTRYTFDNANSAKGDIFRVWSYKGDSRDSLAEASAQFVSSPTTVQEIHAAYGEIRNGSGATTSSNAAAPFVPGQNLGPMLVTGLGSFGGTTARTNPMSFTVNDAQVNYSFTKLMGAHKLMAGGSFDRILLNEVGDLDRAGYYQFTSLQSFLTAQPSQLSILEPGFGTLRHWTTKQIAGYVQDDVRLNRHLTFGLGLRYEMATVPSERDGKVATLRSPLTDTAISVGGPLYQNPSERNFAPRASLAWDPSGNGRTVVRAGAGIFYDLLGTRELLVAGLYDPPFYYRFVIKKPTFPAALTALSTAPPQALAMNVLAYHPNQPYVIQDQIVLEHQFGHAIVAQIGYAGSRGVHLVGSVNDIDNPVPQTLPNGQLYFPPNSTPVNPAFSTIGLRTTSFDSVYHSLNIGGQIKVLKSLQIQSKFTWSKSIDNNSTAVMDDFYSNQTTSSLYNLSKNRGPSDFDTPFVFATNFLYRAPSPESRLAKLVAGGWALAGTIQAQSGTPFNPAVGFDNQNLGGGSSGPGERPNLVPGQPLVTGSPARYFNPLAFSLPANGTAGNLGRNVLRGPGLVVLNLAAERTLWKRERQALRFRGEVFNLANHPNFQIPSALALFDSTGSRLGGSGQITDVTTSSRQIQLSLRYSF